MIEQRGGAVVAPPRPPLGETPQPSGAGATHLAGRPLPEGAVSQRVGFPRPVWAALLPTHDPMLSTRLVEDNLVAFKFAPIRPRQPCVLW